MFSRFLSGLAILLAFAGSLSAREIRVCADPDNLPFSNREGEGFENRITRLVAEEIGAAVTYVWWSERRATAIDLLAAGKCDLVPGTLAGIEAVDTTPPYYRSAYVLVTRLADRLNPATLADPAIRRLMIGAQSIGDDALTPAAAVLIRHGLGSSIRPYSIQGHYSDPNSSAAMVEAVLHGELDAAVLWGPFAGYFAKGRPLAISAIPTVGDDPDLGFDIAMATRRGDGDLLAEVEAALARRAGEVARILADYGVPRAVGGAGPGAK